MLGIKRKRGRPRNDEPREFNDFDLLLIQEFQERPAFYDRGHALYRNHDYLDSEWKIIAKKLGYSVSLLKERILQLRNRYNNEKRRVETLQEQYNDPEITSQWSLYKSLAFLGNHIKQRRTTLGLGRIMSNDRASSEEMERSVSDPLHAPQQLYHRQVTSNNNTPIIDGTDEVSTYTATQPGNTHLLHKRDHGQLVCNQMKPRVSGNGSDKFKAFGQFLTSSLIEMNERDALCLVEKFTADLVNSLLSENESKE